MNHAFLILTHFSPEKTYDLINRLADPRHYFVIHFDKKTQLNTQDPFYIKLTTDPHIKVLTDRVDVQWGGYRIINADLNMMREALRFPAIGYMHLITGQCLPAKSNSYIQDYFNKHNGEQFIDHFLLPDTATGDSLTSYHRVDKYHLYDLFSHRSAKPKDKLLARVNNAARKLQRILKPLGIYRRYPAHYPPVYAGSAWWSLSFDAAKYVVDYVDQHPDFLRRFRYTQFVDEMFIQTVIMGSPFSSKVVNNNLRYIDFIYGTSSPKDLTLEHLPGITAPDALFARKFTDASKELIEFLDKNVY